MKMIISSTLMSWTRFKESRELSSSEYIEWNENQVSPSSHNLIFVSHRWITPLHPDPNGLQLQELQRRLTILFEQTKSKNPFIVFYDYSSLPQRPRSPSEEQVFYRDLKSLESLSCFAYKFIILSEGYYDYINRAWCFFEAISVRNNVHFFDDQTGIKEDLLIREFLMCEDISQITMYDFSYKLDTNESEIITAVFQHLQACKLTHDDDAPIIKEQLISHYNNRRLNSFGKLVTALNKYFSVEFGIMPKGHEDKVYPCKPFFEKPEWIRLPLLKANASIIGGRPGQSLFALPQEQYEEIGKIYSQGFFPLLRLSLPGVSNVQEFLKSFQTDNDWERYIVSPAMLGEKGDCFPTIGHVIHTILERPPGFFCSKNLRYLYFFLSDR